MKDPAAGNLLLLAARLAFGLLLCELGLRVADLGFGSAPMESDLVLHHVNPCDYRFRVYDPNGKYGGHVVQHDSRGYVTDPAAGGDTRRAPARLRIGCFGDSFVGATQVPYDKSFCADRRRGVGRHDPKLRRFQLQPCTVVPAVEGAREGGSAGCDSSPAVLERFPGGRFDVQAGGPECRRGNHCHSRARRFRIREAAEALIRRAADPQGIFHRDLERQPRSGDCRGRGGRFVLAAVPSKFGLFAGREGKGVQFAEAFAEEQQIEYVDLVPPFRSDVSRGTRFSTHPIFISTNAGMSLWPRQ